MSDKMKDQLRDLSRINSELRSLVTQRLADAGDSHTVFIKTEELEKLDAQLASYELLAYTLYVRQQHFDQSAADHRHPSSI